MNWNDPRTIRTFIRYIMSTAISASVIATKAKQMWIMDFNRIDESEKDSEMREMVKTYHVKPGGIHFEEREQKRVA
jgi:hypothetical protein